MNPTIIGDGVVENVVSLANLVALRISRLSSTIFTSLLDLTSLSHLYLTNSGITHHPFPI